MDDYNMITLITALTISITQSCTTEEITVLLLFLAGLRDMLGLYLTQKEIKEKLNNIDNENNKNNPDNINNPINPINPIDPIILEEEIAE